MSAMSASVAMAAEPGGHLVLLREQSFAVHGNPLCARMLGVHIDLCEVTAARQFVY